MMFPSDLAYPKAIIADRQHRSASRVYRQPADRPSARQAAARGR